MMKILFQLFCGVFVRLRRLILPWMEYCATLGGKKRGVRYCDCFWRFDGGEGGG